MVHNSRHLIRTRSGSAYWVERPLPRRVRAPRFATTGAGPNSPLGSEPRRPHRPTPIVVLRRARDPARTIKGDHMKSPIRSGVALVAAAALGAGLALGGAAMSNGNGNGNGNGLGGQPATASQIYLDEIKDYGVCRGVDPTCYHEWGNGWKEGEAKRILIWSRTAGPRHAHLGTPLAPGLNPPLTSEQRRPDRPHRMGGGARHHRRLHRGPHEVQPEQLPGGRVPELQPRHAR